jgi:hypothetical protein
MVNFEIGQVPRRVDGYLVDLFTVDNVDSSIDVTASC